MTKKKKKKMGLFQVPWAKLVNSCKPDLVFYYLINMRKELPNVHIEIDTKLFWAERYCFVCVLTVAVY